MTDASTDFTPNLSLPFLLPSQAQKHVTVNETIAAIDALVMGAVTSAVLNDPPTELSPGDAFIVADLPTGAWAGHAGKLAVWADGAWTFHAPQPGWRLWNIDTGALIVFDGAVWSDLSGSETDFQNIPSVGVATTADASNPLSVRGNGALFTALEVAEGGDGDMRLAVNGEAEGNVAALIFQSGFSGRAEIGLTAPGDFAVRTSANGSAWTDALVVDPATGHVGIGQPPSASEPVNLAAPLTLSNSGPVFSFSDDGQLDMYNDAGGVYLRSRSPGQYMRFGATKSDGSVIDDALYIRPNPEDIILNFGISPETADTLDIGTPVRPFLNLYLTNQPVISSDARRKHNIETFDAGLELIQALNPVTYEREGGDGKRQIGLIAQHVRSALAEQDLLETGIWCVADPADSDSEQAIAYGQLIPVLIDAVNELAERVEDLEARHR